MRIQPILLAPLAVLVLAAPALALPYVTVTDEHVDIVGITYSPESGIGSRVLTESESFDPADVLLYDGPVGSTSVTRPSGSQWDFVGVGAGEPLHLWPGSFMANRIYPGFEAQSIALGTFASVATGDPRVTAVAPWLRVNLMDVRFFDLAGNAAEAEFSLWTIDSDGQPVVWMSTAEGGITAEDLFFILEGGHSHANWGFSRAGYYQIDFQLSGHLTGTNELVESPVTTWHFGVEHLPVAIPEPSTLWLLAAALATGAWIRFRRRADVARR